jgi:hypothetical protein
MTILNKLPSTCKSFTHKICVADFFLLLYSLKCINCIELYSLHFQVLFTIDHIRAVRCLYTSRIYQ